MNRTKVCVEIWYFYDMKNVERIFCLFQCYRNIGWTISYGQWCINGHQCPTTCDKSPSMVPIQSQCKKIIFTTKILLIKQKNIYKYLRSYYFVMMWLKELLGNSKLTQLSLGSWNIFLTFKIIKKPINFWKINWSKTCPSVLWVWDNPKSFCAYRPAFHKSGAGLTANFWCKADKRCKSVQS